MDRGSKCTDGRAESQTADISMFLNRLQQQYFQLAICSPFESMELRHEMKVARHSIPPGRLFPGGVHESGHLEALPVAEEEGGCGAPRGPLPHLRHQPEGRLCGKVGVHRKHIRTLPHVLAQYPCPPPPQHSIHPCSTPPGRCPLRQAPLLTPPAMAHNSHF